MIYIIFWYLIYQLTIHLINFWISLLPELDNTIKQIIKISLLLSIIAIYFLHFPDMRNNKLFLTLIPSSVTLSILILLLKTKFKI